jgi:hypothetical protein
LLVVAVFAASLGGCGDGGQSDSAGQASGQNQPDPSSDGIATTPDRRRSSPPPEFVNDQKVERLLRANLEKGQREVRSVRCPEREPTQRGESFDCTVTFGDEGTRRLTATQINDRGAVTFREP